MMIIAFRFFPLVILSLPVKVLSKTMINMLSSFLSVVIFLALKRLRISIFLPQFIQLLYNYATKQKHGTKGNKESFCNIYWQLFINQ